MNAKKAVGTHDPRRTGKERPARYRTAVPEGPCLDSNWFADSAAPTAFESTIDYTYDQADHLVRAVDSVGGEIDWTYDGLDRLIREATPLGTVSYSYDKAGRRIQMLASGQQSVDYAYDAASRLTELRNAVSATAGQDVVRITYDDADRYSRVQLRNGVNVDYAYDAAGQLTSITYSTAVATIGGLAYAYDAAGRVIRTAGSLAQVNLPAALSGNTYNANNQLTLPGYTYDKNGRLTSNGSQNYVWDSRNQLSQITGATSAQFSYDALGRRTRKSINSTPTQFLYDGPNIIQELADGPSPAITATTLTGLGIDEAFGRTKGTTKTEYLSDRLGSTIALSDTNANSVTTYSYEPYGAATQAGAVDDNARAFTGREDDGTGLLYYRARYSDPANGRFISEDPLGLGGGDFNLYRYVGSDPLDSVDPTGLSAEMCVRHFWPVVITPYARHCFVRFNGDKSDTLSFDPSGVGPDKAPSWLPKTCNATQGKDNDACIKREMKTCSGHYSFNGFNCCHCVEQAFKACQLSVPLTAWPNWPINPGPQPGEAGYLP